MSDTMHPWVAAGRGRIRVGVGVSTRAPEPVWADRLKLAQAAEALGFDSLWVPDHPAFGSDCWTALAALAVSTRRIRLGPLVSCALYRSPVVQARLAGDVDRLSDGRLILGLGAGWLEIEFGLLGLPFPTVPARFAALRETIATVRSLWEGEPFGVQVVEGKMTPTGSALRAGPVQQPGVPLLIGGSGQRMTLRLVAESADMCNFDGSGRRLTGDDIRRTCDVLRRHCDDVVRPYDAIVRSHLLNPIVLAPTRSRLEEKVNALPPIYRLGNSQGYGTPKDLIAYYRQLIEAGAQYLIVNLTTYDDLATLELLVERVVPELQGLAGPT